MANNRSLLFFVNGRKVIDEHPDPETTLLTYIRNKLRLTGSKLGCGEGGCGACTVMVSKWDEQVGRVRHFAVNACLAPVTSVHKCAVTTVEGIGSTRTKLHQVQERLAAHHGSQCGFCTPGFVMSMYALLRNEACPTFKEVETCLQGNLCRCTGYRPIISAFETFTCDKGENCCKNGLANGDSPTNWNPYDSTQEPIFPPELMIHHHKIPESLTFVGDNTTWHQPGNLQEMLDLKALHPDAKIVVGNTEVGIEMNIKGRCYKHLIYPIHVQELMEIKETDSGVQIGASCNLTHVEHFLTNICSEQPREKTQVFSAMLKMLQLFAGAQIRNVACLGGNIMTGSPISDLNPILMACGARLIFESATSGRRAVVMDDTFFTGYRKTNTKPEEVLMSITIPFLTENDVMEAFKQSKRRDDDIAIVNTAILVTFKPNTNIVSKLSMTCGGMAAVTKMARKTMAKAAGRKWNSGFLEDACQWLSDEMELSFDAPGGMVQYRRTLVTSFFFKFYHLTHSRLVERGVLEENDVQRSKLITQDIFAQHQSFTSDQTWQQVSAEQHPEDKVGRAMPHASGLKQVTGEAEYIDDIPPFQDELNMVLVYSTRAHAKIVSVDTTAALQSPGVVDYVDVRDIMGRNETISDDDVFADGKVTCVGHVIGGIVADTHNHAMTASRLVKIEYEDLQPKIITIEDAIEHKSYMENMRLSKGDVDEGFKHCDHILEGVVRVGGQEHFYLETHGCIAIPRNGENEMEIWSSTQDPAALQRMAAVCLGVPNNKVVVRVKRIGGGFGGKETRFCKISSPTAVAAKKLGRPIRCILTRQDDMQITGGRHPFMASYKIGCNNDGRIVALDIDYYNNAGNTEDLSIAVMEKAVLQGDNCFEIPNMKIAGYVCRTNVASNTAFRGFGLPQGKVIVEDWITRVAYHLGITPEEVRYRNLMKDGDIVLYGCKMEGLTLHKCWDDCIRKSSFDDLRKQADKFNRENRWKKRGISCVLSKFGVAFELKMLNQAGALVLIYTDGSVLLFHGGTEMGQGLHTKTIQVASKVLGIPTSFIHVMETSTASVPNAIATAASVGSDTNGMAVKNACEKISERLKPLRKAHPDLSWPSLVGKAYQERISLTATGFYKTPIQGHTWNYQTGEISGDWSHYQTCGAAAAMVEIDVLTGHHVIMKADIVIDVGRSLNPAVDVGQVEGAFTQGFGMMTIEEPLHSSSGQLWTVGPGAYKIPGLSDTPRQFNVHFLRDSPNEVGLYSSRAIGEPPLLLGSSVFCAIKDAIKSARTQAGMTGPFRLDSPATAERIRIACQDNFTDMAQIKQELREGRQPWSVRT